MPGDGLLRQLLPTDGISPPLDAAITWSPYAGWRFVGIELARGVAVPPATGQGQATPSQRATEVVTTLNQKLGPITLHERRMEVAYLLAIPFFSDSKIGVRVTVTVSGTLSLSIKAARLTFTGIGLVWRIPIGEDGEAIDDPIDVKLPDGVAVALTAPSISGGGFPQRIEAPDGRVTWRGGLALRFADSFELAAFAVIELGGNRPYTLLFFVTVRFTPPYPLAFGLKLTTVGGLLALNRTMDVTRCATRCSARRARSTRRCSLSGPRNSCRWCCRPSSGSSAGQGHPGGRPAGRDRSARRDRQCSSAISAACCWPSSRTSCSRSTAPRRWASRR